MTSLDTFLKTATVKQREILQKLMDTGEEENALAEQMNSAADATRGNGMYRTGKGFTVCEDADDYAIVTAGTRQELERVRARMGSYLQEAVANGMKDLGLVQRHYEHYVGKKLE